MGKATGYHCAQCAVLDLTARATAAALLTALGSLLLGWWIWIPAAIVFLLAVRAFLPRRRLW